MKRILKPDGLVIIDVPNHEGITGQAIRNSEDVPVHLYSYSPQTLRRYFEKVGLCVIRIITETRLPHTIYAYLGARAVEMVKLSGSPEQVVQAEKFWDSQNRERNSEYRATARFFESIGHGCHVVAIGTKS